MRIFSKIITVAIITATIISCDKKDDTPKDTPYEPIELETKSASLITSSNKFGLELYKQVINNTAEEENVMISPLSVFQALGMTWNGAAGETQNQMSSVLNYNTELIVDVNKNQKAITDALLGADNKTTLRIANSIWYRQGFDVLQDFINVNQTYFNAEVSALDFSKSEESKTIINNWVSDNTNAKIPEIVDQINPDHVMFLINAVYFYGQWSKEFDTKETTQKEFTKESGEKTTVDMMHQTEWFNCYESDDFSMIELPYGNSHFNMMVLLPKENSKVSNIISSLTDVNWTLWMESMHETNVSLSLPKFKFECDYKLNDYLIAMGMTDAFTAEADFSNIREGGGLSISKVKHKTFIEIDEKGTEAAAVTSVEIIETSMPMVYEFNANKPFVFAITEKDTKAILFMGKLMNP